MDQLDPDDAIFLVDAFLDECKVDQQGHTKGGSEKSTKVCVWLDEDKDDSLIQDVRDLLGSGPEQPLPSHWRNRQTSSLENWTVLRPFMVNNMLSSEKPKEGVCHHCGHKAAVVMCRDCLPRSLYCTACDLSTHEALVLHNRASIVEGFFRHLPPSTFVQQHEKDSMLPIVPPCCDCSTGQTVILIGMNGRYNLFLPSVSCSCGKTLSVTISDLVESGYWPATVNFETLYMVDLFTTYEDLKITAPGMSRQAFVSMLECRTKLFGRSGKICGDTMQRAFLEWAYAKFEVEKLSQVQHFQCPACTPSMLAVAVDGNRKLYRFKSQPGLCRIVTQCTRPSCLPVCQPSHHLKPSSPFVNTEMSFGQTVQRITEATKDLEKLTAELSIQQDIVQQWVSDVQQWTSGGNKRRHQLRKKIALEKKALEVAINDHNTTVGEVGKLPPPNELLAVDNYSWPWECHGDMEQKKNVFDKVMLLARLKEEEVIVVREVKQHMEYMRSVAGLIKELTFQLTEDTNEKCSTEGLMEKGHEGLL
ncbi:hypothetical protein JOB18_002397 [Solea senegalensis]|uniref:CxC3 like cysteine cluster domain-containing protein n=1 Tax=Solea senegalensis TaxID=28829 RepID=A0AAV6R4M8_SOLSE|nr:hypothetical protein JOB18_002397 [Solea senegalensis]